MWRVGSFLASACCSSPARSRTRGLAYRCFVSVERLTELFESRRPCVVLTGAGITTESGIPDFRSAGGIWAQYDPTEVAHIDAFRRDPGAGVGVLRVAARCARRAEPERRPPRARRARGARLDPRDRSRRTSTACTSAPVRATSSRCTARCARLSASTVGARSPLEDAVASLPLPPCPECGEVLKPGVVMFGELLPADGDPARAGTRGRGGSSPRRRVVARGASGRGACPARRSGAGGVLAIVNRGGTPLGHRGGGRARRRLGRDAERASG